MVTVKFYMSELGRTCNVAAIPVTALLPVSFTYSAFLKGFGHFCLLCVCAS